MERIFATASLVGVVSFIVWAGTGYPEPFRVANFSAGPGAMPWEGVSRTVLVLRLKICVFYFISRVSLVLRLAYTRCCDYICIIHPCS